MAARATIASKANAGDDILIAGAGYDLNYFGRGDGDDFVFDGNRADPAGYANGLVLFEGFDAAGELRSDGVTPGHVDFTNNGDGTWTVAFVDPATGAATGEGSTTFAAAEISAATSTARPMATAINSSAGFDGYLF